MFLGGSRIFFDGIDNFVPHDTDWTDFNLEQKHILTIIHNSNGSVFTWIDNKDTIVEFILKHEQFPSRICVFLIPQVVERFDFGPKEWQAAKPLAEKLDRKHKYLGVILDAYLENGEARLTDAQRMAAFECYKEARKNLYNCFI